MRKIKEVLRLHAAGLSRRRIAGSLVISHSTVREYLARAKTAGVSWPIPPEWNDAEVEARLFPVPPVRDGIRPVPDWSTLHEEYTGRRRSGVTLQLLWIEYREENPDGLAYSRFCERYSIWREGLDRVLRHEHKAGEKVFVDYAGQTVPIIDRATGEIRQAQIFVGVLGCSNFTYADASWSQELPDWVGSHVRMFHFFQGVPELVVPDNLKSGVRQACFYEPDINPTYHELAVHYGTAVMPARKRKPRDKAKAEAGVLLVERWILARLRKHTFFSLTDLNREIARLLEALNDRPFQKLDGTRRSRFESLERPQLKPLPAERYEFAQWKRARVNIDYHVEVLGHYYSVPHRLFRQQVDVRITAQTVEILHSGSRVAAHVRSNRRGAHTTLTEHRPKSHQEYLEWTPTRIVAWAEKIGPRTGELTQSIIENKPHPEQGYRACLGIIRLAKTYSEPRLEAACDRALRIGGLSYRSVNSILKAGLDRTPLEEQATLALPQDHAHVRGSTYYANTPTGATE